MELSVLPLPKKYELKDDTFYLYGCNVCIDNNLDMRIIKAATKLKNKLQEKTGTFHKLTRINNLKNSIIISKSSLLTSEEYTIDISKHEITIIGGDDAGCFYAIGTLMQLINTTSGLYIPTLFINDKPDMKHRGFYHDISRGRVPTVDGIKSLVDLLAKVKINSLQLYVEHTFEFNEFKTSNYTDQDYLTAEEILEIDQYCYDNFIDFIPSLSTFGHLYELLMKKEYAHLCELENYKPTSHFWIERMLHHTINPSDLESFKLITSLIDQYLPLFRSKYFNICCDETFDLGKGKNINKDSSQLYIDFVSKISKHITDAGKNIMMWADIVLNHQELLQQIPNDTILLNWCYNANPDINRIKTIAQQKKTQIVCPGTNSWRSLLEILSVSVSNIEIMIKNGFEHGAIGVLNTNWGDYGHPAHIECAYYSTVYAACLSWNTSTKHNVSFEQTVSRLIYGVDGNIIPLIRELGDIHKCASWTECLNWQITRDSSVFGTNASVIKTNITRCNEIYAQLSEMHHINDTLHPIIVAAKGILLLNQAALQIKSLGCVDDQWHTDAKKWFEEYKNCWLKDNKYSELNEIKKFFKNM